MTIARESLDTIRCSKDALFQVIIMGSLIVILCCFRQAREGGDSWRICASAWDPEREGAGERGVRAREYVCLWRERERERIRERERESIDGCHTHRISLRHLS